jgi:hypothetical protein
MRSLEEAEALLDQLPVVESWTGGLPEFEKSWTDDVPVQGPIVARNVPFYSFTEASKANAPTKLIPISGMYTSQLTVDRELVRRLMSEPWNAAPIVMPWEGRWAVQDGHHRITAAMLRGAAGVLCRIVQPSDRAPHYAQKRHLHA